MKSGRLRARVLIQTPTKVDLGGGEYSDSWPAAGVGTYAWAEIAPVSASAMFSLGVQGATASHTVTMRYNEVVTSLSRIVYQGRTYYVTDPPIDVGARHREIRFNVQEKVA